jgi:methionyl-tRNA synthetase
MMLMGYEGLNVPYDVPANQYVNFSATQKQSKSKGTGNWMLDLLDSYAPDVVRFYLTTVLPETNDTEFREEDLVRANNDVLIATWGNLANRVISMIHRNFGGIVPEVGKPRTGVRKRSWPRRARRSGRRRQRVRACHFRGALQGG